VHPHAHAQAGGRQSVLSGRGGRDRIRRSREDDGERVALRVHLDAAVTRPDIAEQSMVLTQQVGVAIAELAQEQGRTLDIGEQERDRAGR
jgi:hypothetical protein